MTRGALPPGASRASLRAAAALLLGLLAAEAAARFALALRNGAWAPGAGRDAFELYAIGESTMAGEPYAPRLSVPAVVADRLGGEAAGRRIVVRNLARAGESIYPQATRLELALRGRDPRRPGALLIYAGHNDSYFGQPPSLSRYEALKERVLCRSVLLSLLAFQGERLGLLPKVRDIASYEHYMRRAIELGRAAGLQPVLSTVIGNVADIDPGLFLDPASPPTREAALAFLRKGADLEAGRRYDEAIRHYERLSLEFPPAAPYLTYRAGACHRKLGRFKEAGRLFWEAIDAVRKDGFGRATTRHNALIRRLAAEYGIPLADAVRTFEARSPHGLAGSDLFIDGHHPNLRGYGLLTDAFARALAGALGGRVLSDAPTPEDVARRFSLGVEQRAFALVMSGGWFYVVSARHAAPALRLALAEERFREAAALRPDDPAAWIGLGLALAARRNPAWVQDEGLIDWQERNRLFGRGSYPIAPERVPELLRRLKDDGVPGDVLDRIAATNSVYVRAQSARTHQ
ncbi:MAG: hypothetical protein HY927_00490 [Elusimicrobia bacterium]|nr:hypothetical protein [Elusimicrobiota bacterium]